MLVKGFDAQPVVPSITTTTIYVERFNYSAVFVGGFVYLLGGYIHDDTQAVDVVQVFYNNGTEAFEMEKIMSPMTTARGGMLVVSDAERFIYTVGGRQLPSLPYLPVVEVLDTATGEWTTSANFSISSSSFNDDVEEYVDSDPNLHLSLFGGGLLVSQVASDGKTVTIGFINGTEYYLYPPVPTIKDSSCELGLMAVVDSDSFMFFCSFDETYIFSSQTAWSKGDKTIFGPVGMLVGVPWNYKPTDFQQIDQLYRLDTVLFLMNGTSLVTINPCAMLSSCPSGVEVYSDQSNVCVTNQIPSNNNENNNKGGFSYTCSPLNSELLLSFTMDHPNLAVYGLAVTNQTFIVQRQTPFSTLNFTLNAIDAINGTQKWSYVIPNQIGIDQYFIDTDSEVVYIIINNTISAYDLHTFAMLWEEPLLSSASNPVEIIWSGVPTQLFLLYNHSIAMFNLQTQSIQWKAIAFSGGDSWNPPISLIYTSNSVLYYQYVQDSYFYWYYGHSYFNDGTNITAIDIATGDQLWDTRMFKQYKNVDGTGYTFVTANDDNVLISCDLELISISASNASNVQWRHRLPKCVDRWAVAALLENSSIAVIQNANATDAASQLILGIDIANGTRRWLREAYVDSYSLFPSFQTLGDRVLIFTEVIQEYIRYSSACDARTGETVWRYYSTTVFPSDLEDRLLTLVSPGNNENWELRAFNLYPSGEWWTPTLLPN